MALDPDGAADATGRELSEVLTDFRPQAE